MPMGLAGQEMPVGWTQRAADCHRAVDLSKRAGNATCFRVVSFCGGGWVNEFNEFKIHKKKMMRKNHLESIQLSKNSAWNLNYL